jgi:hypothetical protein
VRALLYVRIAGGKTDERGFAALEQVASELPPAKRLGLARFKEMVREQFLILLRDEERAIAALPKLLPEDRRERETALDLLRRVLAARGRLSEEENRRFRRIEGFFAAAPAKAKEKGAPQLAETGS